MRHLYQSHLIKGFVCVGGGGSSRGSVCWTTRPRSRGFPVFPVQAPAWATHQERCPTGGTKPTNRGGNTGRDEMIPGVVIITCSRDSQGQNQPCCNVGVFKHADVFTHQPHHEGDPTPPEETQTQVEPTNQPHSQLD